MSTANSDYNQSHVFALALCMSIYTPDRNQEKDNKMNPPQIATVMKPMSFCSKYTPVSHTKSLTNVLWALGDKGTSVRFCWGPSHCGIEGNETVDQLAKAALDHDIYPLKTVYYADLKPQVNSYIKEEVQTNGMYLYMVEICILWNQH